VLEPLLRPFDDSAVVFLLLIAVVPVAAAPPVPPLVPPPAPSAPCAKAIDELIARIEAKAIVVSLMSFFPAVVA
jgi:hypothetical protein